MKSGNSIVDLFGNRPVPNPSPGRSKFNAYAAGNKLYGAGRRAPNLGPVSGSGMLGYKERDHRHRARRNAIIRRLKAQQTGNPMNSNLNQNPISGVF